MSDIPMSLKEYRVKLGMSQRELAEALNVTQATISRYEGRRQLPKIGILKKIQDFSNGAVCIDSFTKDKP